MAVTRSEQRKKRHKRVRKKVFGTASRPRLVVFRSSKHISAQLVDDTTGRVLAAASTLEKLEKASEASDEGRPGSKVEAAKLVGKVIGERALKQGIFEVVFDRGGYKYHGRVAALADGAREAGLKF